VLKRRWKELAFVLENALTVGDLRENRMRPRRISWKRLAAEWWRRYKECVVPATLERRFKRACADPQVWAAWEERRESLHREAIEMRPELANPRELESDEVAALMRSGLGERQATELMWEALLALLVLPLRKVPASLWAGLRRRPVDIDKTAKRFYRAYCESPKFRQKFYGAMRRQGTELWRRFERTYAQVARRVAEERALLERRPDSRRRFVGTWSIQDRRKTRPDYGTPLHALPAIRAWVKENPKAALTAIREHEGKSARTSPAEGKSGRSWRKSVPVTTRRGNSTAKTRKKAKTKADQSVAVGRRKSKPDVRI